MTAADEHPRGDVRRAARGHDHPGRRAASGPGPGATSSWRTRRPAVRRRVAELLGSPTLRGRAGRPARRVRTGQLCPGTCVAEQLAEAVDRRSLAASAQRRRAPAPRPGARGPRPEPMRILMLAHRIPYPPHTGDKVRAYQVARHLARSSRADARLRHRRRRRPRRPRRARAARCRTSSGAGSGSRPRSPAGLAALGDAAARSASPTSARGRLAAPGRRAAAGRSATTRSTSPPRPWRTTSRGCGCPWSWTSSTWTPTSGPSTRPSSGRRARGPTASRAGGCAASRPRPSAGAVAASSPPPPRRRCSRASRPGRAPR